MLTTSVLVAALLIAFIQALRTARRMRDRQDRPPYTEPDGDPTTLQYCTGCGHNHRRQWMTWVAADQYHCSVCCHERDKDLI